MKDKIAYFDCSSGISGNMILGALIDSGVSPSFIKKELRDAGILDFQLRSQHVRRGGISGIYVIVKDKSNIKRRNLRDILYIIKVSKLSKFVKEKASIIFNRLAVAEGKVHGVSKEKVHFHEIGGVDCLVDVLGTLIGLEFLGVSEFYSSPLNVGSGKIKSNHGYMPVPAPGTLELLRGAPIYNDGTYGELVTPTGAAILTTICNDFGIFPEMRVRTIGYGAGRMELPFPNLLRIIIGENDKITGLKSDIISVIETNIDDSTPEMFGSSMDRLFKAGAIDVFITPIYMKKNRPSAKLTVLSKQSSVSLIERILFEETSTLGVRKYIAMRTCLPRNIIPVKTKYGIIRMKTAELNGDLLNFSPEYEDCRKAADKFNKPFKRVYDEVKSIYAMQKFLGRKK